MKIGVKWPGTEENDYENWAAGYPQTPQNARIALNAQTGKWTDYKEPNKYGFYYICQRGTCFSNFHSDRWWTDFHLYDQFE